MEKRRWIDDLEVEERKIEDQASQQRAVAVLQYLLFARWCTVLLRFPFSSRSQLQKSRAGINLRMCPC